MKILVALDESDNAMRAVEFVVGSFKPEYEITLFSVVQNTEAICDFQSPELTPYFRSQRNVFCSLEDKKKELIVEAVQKAQEKLMEAGFKEEHITTKIEDMKKGVARDILNEADSGYDAIVLGRRGVSGIREFFLGSVSQKVLQSSKDLSIIIAK